jgi:SAM-dependent methyltransferase
VRAARSSGEPISVSAVGAEALDTPALDRDTARATLADIARSNLLFGGRAAVVWGVGRLLVGGGTRRPLTIVDVGAGAGDVLVALAGALARRGITMAGLAIDWHREAARMAGERRQAAVVGDALRLPLGDRAVDIVVASQLLHHFAPATGVRLLRELDRVARVGVVISDLRRARMAAAGIWLAAHALRFHPVSREDGVVSVRRGFAAKELRGLCAAAGIAAHVHRRPGYRIVAHWRADRANR